MGSISNRAETGNGNGRYNKNLGIHEPRKRGGGMASTSRTRRRPVKGDVTGKDYFAAARLDDQWMLVVCGWPCAVTKPDARWGPWLEF
jgi:hypothetical protein